jgi:hypothetical protein
MNTTDQIMPLHTAIAVIGGMERMAHKRGLLPYALGMNGTQWCTICTAVMEQQHTAELPKCMRPTIPGMFGAFHGYPVLPQQAPGIALHFK